MNLFINRNLDASISSVNALNDNSGKDIPTLYLGDVLDLDITLVDGAGGYDAELENAVLKVAIGNLASGAIYANTDSFEFDTASKFWKGTLVLSTESLANALNGLTQNNFTLKYKWILQIKPTIFQQSIQINNQLILQDTDYTDGGNTNTETIYAHYKFNSITENGNIEDSSGNNFDLTYTGNLQTGNGRFGNSVYFNGSFASHYHNANNLTALGNAYTFSLWIKPDNLNVANDAGIISYGLHGIDYKQYFQVYQIDSRLVTKSNYISNTLVSSYTFTPDEWVNITLVKESSTTQNLYINGELYFTALNPNWGNNEANRLNVGKYGNFGFEGFLDDLRIYNKALNGEEVRLLYNPNPITKNYIEDNSSDIEIGDYLKITTYFETNGIKFNQDEIVIVNRLIGTGTLELKKSNNELANVPITYRGNKLIKIISPYPDSDSDGVPDSIDAFPNDSTQSTDTDSDGVGDATDYFYDNASYTQSKEDLDAYAEDIHKTPATGDIIKILEDFTINNDTLEKDSYHIILNVNTGINIKISVDGVNYNPSISSRTTKWEIVNPSDNLAPAPVDTDSDGVDDTLDYFSTNANYTQTQAELDAYSLDVNKVVASGDIIKILQDFTIGANNFNYIQDSYYYIISVSSSNIQITRPDRTNAVNIPLADRTSNWEIVNPSGSLAPPPYAYFYDKVSKVFYNINTAILFL